MKKMFVLCLTLGLAQAAFAGAPEKFSMDMDADDVQELAQSGIYDEGGSRAGMFFSDFREAAQTSRYEYVESFYQDTFIYQIADYDIVHAIQWSRAGGGTFRNPFPYQLDGVVKWEEVKNLEMRLEALRDSYKYSNMPGKTFKTTFMKTMGDEHDRRATMLGSYFTSGLTTHNGSYRAMLADYAKELEKIEHRRMMNGFAEFGSLLPYIAFGLIPFVL